MNWQRIHRDGMLPAGLFSRAPEQKCLELLISRVKLLIFPQIGFPEITTAWLIKLTIRIRNRNGLLLWGSRFEGRHHSGLKA